MKTVNEITFGIIEIVKKVLEKEIDIDMNDDLTGIGLDSVVFVELILTLEETYSINFNEEEETIGNFSTINKIVDLIDRKLKI